VSDGALSGFVQAQASRTGVQVHQLAIAAGEETPASPKQTRETNQDACIYLVVNLVTVQWQRCNGRGLLAQIEEAQEWPSEQLYGGFQDVDATRMAFQENDLGAGYMGR